MRKRRRRRRLRRRYGKCPVGYLDEEISFELKNGKKILMQYPSKRGGNSHPGMRFFAPH